MHTAVLPYLKTYAALVGAIATALLGVFAADTTVGQVLTVVSVIATAVVTWAVPNVDTSAAYYNPEGGNRKILGKAAMSPMAPRKREDGRADLLYVLVVVLVVLVILALVGVL